MFLSSNFWYKSDYAWNAKGHDKFSGDVINVVKSIDGFTRFYICRKYKYLEYYEG